MSNEQKAEQATEKKELQVLNSVDGYKFAKGTILKVKTSIAFNGDDRSAGNAKKVNINVDLSGVKLSDFASAAAGQLRVEFQRSRRDAESNGVFKSKKAYDEYLTDTLGIDLEDEKSVGEVTLHYNNVSKSPAQKMSTEEASSELDRILSQMSPEARDAYLASIK